MDAATRERRPRVVIVGAGFAGLYAARRLAQAPVDVTLVDRTNHHLFQPLLYEVATAALSAPDVAEPIRRVFSGLENVTVLMAEAVDFDLVRRRVRLRTGGVDWDWLVVATGASHAYFGHDDWARLAPGLKTIADALAIRQRFLLAFESAERETDPAARRAKLTFVIVGAGPTGVELAGTMSEVARRALPADFRAIDTKTTRVILVEGQDRVLPTFAPELSRRALAHLEELGVEVRLKQMVTRIDETGVELGAERIGTASVFWAAGMAASPLGRALGAEVDRSGRVVVRPDLTIPGHPEVFVVGDLAAVRDPEEGTPVPGVAPAAIQMGTYVADRIVAELGSGPHPGARPPFRYRDKGMLATIGRARAVGQVGRLRLSGLAAWLAWALVHIYYLIGFRNRLIVMLRWAWAYLVFTRGARLITGGPAAAQEDTDDRRPPAGGVASGSDRP